MAIFIKKNCVFCFHAKTLRLTPPGFLKPLKLLIYLWTNIFVNYIINLPKCLYNGKIYKYIFVVINHLIKIKPFIFVISLNTKELIKAFIHIIYKLHNVLNIIISSKGLLFIFDF